VPGFGISSADHVRAYARAGADGFIVGSAIVRLVGDHVNQGSEMEAAIGRLVRELKEAASEGPENVFTSSIPGTKSL
jgi:tryptophan synthase alpha chain